MDRVSDDDLDLELDWNWHTPRIKSLLTELRERREAEREQLAWLTKKVDDGMAGYHKAPCPEHAKMVEGHITEWWTK